MRDVTGCYVFVCRIAMDLLVIEENISTKSSQERTFGFATQEQCLINAYTPLPQGQDDTFVGGC